MEIIFVALVLAVVVIIAVKISASSGNKNMREEVLATGFKVSDRLDAQASCLMFDDTNKNVAITWANGKAVVPYQDVRQWSYEPLHALNGNHLGWTVRLTTSNPMQPLYNLPIRNTRRDLPELWMAKIAAHING